MTMAIFQIVAGSILLIELIICIIGSKSASDYTYYLCRPFNIPVPMGIGAIIRLVCAVLGAILLYRGVIDLLAL